VSATVLAPLPEPEPAAASRGPGARLRIACVVCFLDEQTWLPTLLGSIAAQQRFPDQLVLVDDGSRDGSAQIAEEFAATHERVRVLRRARRTRAGDRLAQASELRSFQWALATLEEPWDVVAKMDADLQLPADLFATLERAFLQRPLLGIAGAHLSVREPHGAAPVRERCPAGHVRGATKFYRRTCLQQISPLPAILGWDTIDELSARARGWQTASVACARGDVVHLRPTGSRDGMLRAQYRWGQCAWGIGQHPLWVLLSAARRIGERPRASGPAAFLAGWATAAFHRRPRARPELRARVRREELLELRHRVGCRGRA
jgi:biofilm PGA synthesis N-glycosyltransferase PgaC